MGGCRNGDQQLVVRHLWCTDHMLGFLVWWPSPTCNHERYTPYITEPPLWGTVGLMLLWVYVFFCLQILIRPSVTWNRNRLSSDQWMLRQVVKFKSRRAKHHAKRNHWCRSDKMGRLITLLDFSPADFKRFHTVLADRRLFGNHCLYRTGLVANGIRLTKQYSVLSSCCDVTCGLLDLYKSFKVLVWVCFSFTV